MYPRTEMLDLVLVDGHAKGIVVRDMVTGAITSHAARLRAALHRRLRQRLLSLDQRERLQRHRGLSRLQARRALRQSLLHADSSRPAFRSGGDYQSKLTLMSESLRNDGRVLGAEKEGRQAPAEPDSRGGARLLSRAQVSRASAISRRATSPRARPRKCATTAAASAPADSGVYLDFADAIKRLGEDGVRERYGNLFDMYHQITGENAYKTPMRIYPAVHYTMGGLWVDYNLMSNVPGLFVLGEANFSDHGANRLGASALMQGLADGYFVIPYTIGNYLAPQIGKRPTTDRAEFKKAEAEVRERTQRLLGIKGKRSVDHFHRELGRIMWDYCGMARSEKSLEARAAADPAAARGILEERQRPRRRRGAQRLAGEGRAASPTSSNSANCSASTPWSAANAAAAISARNSNTPTAKRKARRRDNFQHVAAWEFTGRRQQADPQHRAARYSKTRASRACGATSNHESQTQSLASERREKRRRGSSISRRATFPRTARSSRCSTS